MTTRREILGLGALGVGALGTASWLRPAPDFAALSGAHPWDAVRAEFAFAHQDQPRIPLNAANLTPSLSAVSTARHAATLRLDADASFHHRRLFLHAELPRLRVQLSAQLGLKDPDDVALVRNTSEANACIIQGLHLQAEDEVVLWNENHHSNLRSWAYRAERTGFHCRSVHLPADPVRDEELIEPFLAALQPRTRVVSFSAISNVSGLRLPVEALCRAIHAQDERIFVHVDGAQAWGATALDLPSLDCDSFSSSAHKWLLGPRELGILYLRRSRAGELAPMTIGYDLDFNYPVDGLAPHAGRLQNLGQRDDAALPALAVALSFQGALGAQRIEQRIAELALRLSLGLDRAGFRLLSPQTARYSHGVVVADLGAPRRAVAAFRQLYEHHGIYAAFVHGNRVLCGPEQVDPNATDLALRLCPHVYNTEEDIDRTLVALRRIAGA